MEIIVQLHSHVRVFRVCLRMCRVACAPSVSHSEDQVKDALFESRQCAVLSECVCVLGSNLLDGSRAHLIRSPLGASVRGNIQLSHVTSCMRPTR